MKARQALRLTAALLLILLLLPFGFSAQALDDDEFGGYPSDTLSIQVGYAGGPYFEKRLFTLAELSAMDIVYADYTFIDNMPSVIIAHVKGVRLADVVDAAGIDVGNVSYFHFWIRDKAEASYTSFSKSELLDTTRYCYYSLPDNFDYDEGAGNELATADRERVETVLALADDWSRALAGASFGSDYMNLNENTRFRLIFGQTDAVTNTASRSAKWVYSITVELRGEPAISLNETEISLFIGDSFKLDAAVDADSTVAANVPVEWLSSDDSVAAVEPDGTVTARKSGTAVITANFLSASASVTVTVSSPKPSAPPTTGTTENGGDTAVATTPDNGEIADIPTETPGEAPPDTTPSIPPEDTKPPEPTPEEEEDPPPPESPPPEEITPEAPVSPLPVIGIAVMSLFAVGALAAWLRTRSKSKKRKNDNQEDS